MRARTIGYAQASAEIMRVSHAIKQQQQWRPLYCVKQFGQIARERQGPRARNHALVTARANHRVKALVIRRYHADIRALRGAQQIAHATIVARCIHINFFHR
jgi:hypothetical protein